MMVEAQEWVYRANALLQTLLDASSRRASAYARKQVADRAGHSIAAAQASTEERGLSKDIAAAECELLSYTRRDSVAASYQMLVDARAHLQIMVQTFDVWRTATVVFAGMDAQGRFAGMQARLDAETAVLNLQAQYEQAEAAFLSFIRVGQSCS